MSFELQVPSIPACMPRSQTIEPNASHSQIVITSAPSRSRPIDSSRWMTTGKGQWLAAGLRSFVGCRGRGNSLYRAEDMLHLLHSSYYSVDLLWTQFCSVLETLLVSLGCRCTYSPALTDNKLFVRFVAVVASWRIHSFIILQALYPVGLQGNTPWTSHKSQVTLGSYQDNRRYLKLE